MKNKESLGVASMVCGIISIVLFWFPYLSIPCGIVAIVLSRKCAKYGVKSSSVTAGLVTGIIGLVLSFIVLVFAVVLASVLFTSGYY